MDSRFRGNDKERNTGKIKTQNTRMKLKSKNIIIGTVLTLLLLPIAGSCEESADHYERGVRHFALGDYENAVMAYERAFMYEEHARIKLELAACYYEIGRSYDKLGLHDVAEKHFKDVLAMKPAPPASVRRKIERYLDVIRAGRQTDFFSGSLTLGLTRGN